MRRHHIRSFFFLHQYLVFKLNFSITKTVKDITIIFRTSYLRSNSFILFIYGLETAIPSSKLYWIAENKEALSLLSHSCHRLEVNCFCGILWHTLK